MEYKLIHAGKEISISLEQGRDTQNIKAIVNDKELETEIIPIDQNNLTMKIGDMTYKTSVVAEGDRVYVHIGGNVLIFDNVDSEHKTFSKDLLEFGAKDRVTTPMPGKVVKLLVKVGEAVKARQPLVIVESMKMENEIKSPSDGVIKSVNFAEGDLVGTGQPIILLEPTES